LFDINGGESYVVDRAIDIVNLTINGFGSTLEDSSDNYAAVQITGKMDVTFRSVQFVNNTGKSGGAVRITSRSYLKTVSFEDCIFRDNRAINGSAVYLDGARSLYTESVLFLRTTFSYNEAIFGAGVYMNTGCSKVFLKECTVDNNSAYNGAALYMSFKNSNIYFYNSTMVDNTASNFGGAVYLGSQNSKLYIDGCSFLRNTAYKGGALYFNRYSTTVMFEGTDIRENKATYGAGIYMGFYNNYVSFVLCTITQNTASQQGGGMYADSNNDRLVIDSSEWRSNTANAEGGALCFVGFNYFTAMTDSIFESNDAKSGGALYVSASCEDCTIRRCTFLGNRALSSHGGAINIVKAGNRLVIADSDFTSNVADSLGQGAALYLDSSASVVITNCRFERNTAAIGGSITLGASNDNTLVESSLFISNVAQGGGALYLESNKYTTVLNCTFRNNLAYSAGGAIYVKSATFSLKITKCMFDQNEANAQGGAIKLDKVDAFVSPSTFLNCVFVMNKSPFGAAMYISISTQVNITGALFDRNIASQSGGGVTISQCSGVSFFDSILTGNGAQLGAAMEVTQSLNILTHNCIFHDNKAVQGGGVYATNQVIDVLFRNCVWKNNIATDSGAAMFFLGQIYRFDFVQCQFLSNTAMQYGGAVYFGSITRYFLLEDSVFQGNIAMKQSGGAIYSIDGDDLQVMRCNFTNNTAPMGNGGALALSSWTVDIFESHFIDNFANSGGGVYFSGAMEINMDRCNIRDNSAITMGGGLVFFDSIDGAIVHSSLTNNSVVHVDIVSPGGTTDQCGSGSGSGYAGSGGSILVALSTYLNITSSVLQTSIAFSGGGVYITSSEHVRMTDCKVIDNRGSTGAAVHVDYVDHFSCEDSELSRNFATAYGAGIFAKESKNIMIVNSLFESNYAQNASGSALFLSSSEVGLIGNSFLKNSAPRGGGGGVYWSTFSGMVEPFGILNNTYEANIALYGGNYATDSWGLWFDNPYDNVYVTDYTTYVPTIMVKIVDYYNETVRTARMYVDIAPVVKVCNDGTTAYVSGGVTQEIINGNSSFSSINAVCAPGDNMNITASSTIALSTVALKTFSATTTIYFRECQVGETLSNSICIQCPENSYTFESGGDKCYSCPEHSTSCYGSIVDVEVGYWRISNDSVSLLECPMGSASCLGGTNSNDASCRKGYHGEWVDSCLFCSCVIYQFINDIGILIGPLCAVCDDDYGYVSSRNECLICEDLHINPVMIVGLVTIVLLLAVAVYSIFFLPEDWSSVFAPIKGLATRMIQKKSPSTSEGRESQWGADKSNGEMLVVQTSLSPLNDADISQLDGNEGKIAQDVARISRVSMSNAEVLDSLEKKGFDGT
jgi:predicted outer membrane repeat protein